MDDKETEPISNVTLWCILQNQSVSLTYVLFLTKANGF